MRRGMYRNEMHSFPQCDRIEIVVDILSFLSSFPTYASGAVTKGRETPRTNPHSGPWEEVRKEERANPREDDRIRQQASQQ